ncbi:MAG: hypothetical protein AB7J13_11410 [Pyrinomonadaceae bacterium]
MQNAEFTSGRIRPIECVKEGFELIKSDYWLLLGIVIVGGMIGGVTLFIALGAMSCGIFNAYLKKIDGGSVAFDDLFKGFSWFWSSLLVTAVIVVPMVIVYVVIYVPVLMAAMMGPRLSQDEFLGLFLGALAVDLVFIVIMVCVHTLLIFAFPLIVDRGLSGVKAMTTSARAVFKNMGGVVGLFLVNFGLVLLGELALCIGIYFVLPIIVAANMVAYRKVFPRIAGDPYQQVRMAA